MEKDQIVELLRHEINTLLMFHKSKNRLRGQLYCPISDKCFRCLGRSGSQGQKALKYKEILIAASAILFLVIRMHKCGLGNIPKYSDNYTTAVNINCCRSIDFQPARITPLANRKTFLFFATLSVVAIIFCIGRRRWCKSHSYFSAPVPAEYCKTATQ